MTEGNALHENCRDEIESALKIDTQRLGDVFKERDENGDYDVSRIAEKMGLTVGPVHYIVRSIHTLLECRRFTASPTLARQRASMLRSFVKRHAGCLSPDTRQKLNDLADEHDRVATDEDAIIQENKEIELPTDSRIPRGLAGVYVYTLPHYIKYPVVPSEEDDTNPRTYLKIGHSNDDIWSRVRQQNTTAIPEPPLILRMYRCPNGEIERIERDIHRHLIDADHNPHRSAGAGKEWFLTHLRLIDSTASLLGLEVVYSHPNY